MSKDNLTRHVIHIATFCPKEGNHIQMIKWHRVVQNPFLNKFHVYTLTLF